MTLQTQIFKDNPAGIAAAAKIIQNGGLVAMPTETVYGLAADALNAEAVRSIFIAKGRAQDNPLIVHIAQWTQLPPLVTDIPQQAEQLANAFWPGPLTMIFQKSPTVPDTVTCGMDTVAIRMPSHPVAQALIMQAGVPVAAPSANLSGGVSPVTAQHCIDDLTGRVDAIIDGGPCRVGLESTVILLCGTQPVLLRPGFVTKEQIEAVIGSIQVDDAVLHPLRDGVRPASPGMKYKHYAPKAKVVILNGGAQAYAQYVNQHAEPGVMALCFEEDLPNLQIPTLCYGRASDAASQATLLFDMLRRADEQGATLVYARMPDGHGVGLAVLNRLLRAAAFDVIQL